MTTDQKPTVLIIGVSRGIGRGLTAEYLRRGWRVIGTVRNATDEPALRALADGSTGEVRLELLDMTRPAEIAALHDVLDGQRLDVLLVNAGVSDDNVPVAETDESAFNRVMTTNALAPLRVVEALQDLVADDGTIVAMSSRQGSLTLNEQGGFDVYRASKSALNQLMRSYAARHRDSSRALLLVAPGWVQTDLGGPGALLTVEQSATGVVDTIEANHGTPGLRYLDYQNTTIAW